MPDLDGTLSLNIPGSAFPTKVNMSPRPLTSVLSAESDYSHASIMDYTPASPSFEFTDILSPETYEPAIFAMPTDQTYQYLSLGQTKHNSQPNTPTKLQTAFDHQWLGPATSVSDAPDANVPFRPRSQTVTTPQSCTYAPYNQPFALCSSFAPITPASGGGLPPTPFMDLAKDQLHHTRMPSVSDSVSSISSVTSSLADSPFDGVSDLPLPSLVNGKPPRFKPTAKQLAMLLQTYERTKHINAEERERLARRLGGGVKPRHVQVWFQNRRSKSRNKESPMATSALDFDASPSTTRYLSDSGLLSIEDRYQGIHGERLFSSEDQKKDHLLRVVNESQPDLIFLPITKIAIGDWSRLLSSISATSSGCGPVPDLLGYASPSAQTLTWYLSYAACSYKLVYSLAVIVSVTSEGAATSTRDGTVAVRFETCAPPLCYTLTPEGWVLVADFTDGRATSETCHIAWGPSEGLAKALRDLSQVSSAFANACRSPGLQASACADDIQVSLRAFHFPQNIRRRSDGVDNAFTSLQPPSLIHVASTSSEHPRGHRRRRSASQPLQPSGSVYAPTPWMATSNMQHDYLSQSSTSIDLPFIDMSALHVGSQLPAGSDDCWDTTMEPTPTHTTPGFSPAVWSPVMMQTGTSSLHQQLPSPSSFAPSQPTNVVIEDCSS